MHTLPYYKQRLNNLSSARWGMTTEALPDALSMLHIPSPTSLRHFTLVHGW